MCNSMTDKALLSSLARYQTRISSHDLAVIFHEPHDFVMDMIEHLHEDYPEYFTQFHFRCTAPRNNGRYTPYYTLTLEGFYFLCRYSLSNVAKECTELHFEAMDVLSEHLESLLDDYAVKH